MFSLLKHKGGGGRTALSRTKHMLAVKSNWHEIKNEIIRKIISMLESRNAMQNKSISLK